VIFFNIWRTGGFWGSIEQFLDVSQDLFKDFEQEIEDVFSF
jgi:hypothetical protein